MKLNLSKPDFKLVYGLLN